MNPDSQALLIEYLVSSPDLWARCQHIIKADYFDPEFRDTVKFIQNYHTNYRALPSVDKVAADTGLKLTPKQIAGDDLEYWSDETEKFCRNKAMEHAIREGSKDLAKNDFGSIEKKIREAVTVSLHKDLGTNYWDDPTERLERLKNKEATYSTGWPTFDRVLYGGLNKKEMVIFTGESGGGKSVTMQNLGRNLSKQGYNGIYYSLELSEDVVASRMDSMMTNISQSVIKGQPDQVAQALALSRGTMGKFIIKQFPSSTTSVLTLRAHLTEFQLIHGWTPDYIIVDYLDLMAPMAKVDLGNLFIKDKYVSEELRSLAVEFDCLMITASQLNRSAVDQEKHDHSMIAGGISKIQTADNVVSIRYSEKMRATGEIAFQFMKTRSSNGQGTKIYMSIDDCIVIKDDLGGKPKSGPTTNVSVADLLEDDEEITPAVTKPKNSNVNNLMGMFPDDDDD